MSFYPVLKVLIELCALFSSDNNEWKSVAILIGSNGEFNAEADYSNAEVSYDEYMDNWKKKYLV